MKYLVGTRDGEVVEIEADRVEAFSTLGFWAKDRYRNEWFPVARFKGWTWLAEKGYVNEIRRTLCRG